MELILQKENEDGSADFDLTISPLEVQALVNLGFEYEERKETLETLLKTKFLSKLKLIST